jgi:hypothetical protein
MSFSSLFGGILASIWLNELLCALQSVLICYEPDAPHPLICFLLELLTSQKLLRANLPPTADHILLDSEKLHLIYM